MVYSFSDKKPEFSKIIFTSVSFMLCFELAHAQTGQTPEWVTPIVHGEIKCFTKKGQGIEWDPKVQAYNPKGFQSRMFIIQKIDINDTRYQKLGCEQESRPEGYVTQSMYSRAACYRINNAPNMVGWTQGWCKEKYSKNGTVNVACENDKISPKIGFSPNGYFYSYGAIYQVVTDDPFVSHAYTELGQCFDFTAGYPTRFKFGRDEVFYKEN